MLGISRSWCTTVVPTLVLSASGGGTQHSMPRVWPFRPECWPRFTPPPNLSPFPEDTSGGDTQQRKCLAVLGALQLAEHSSPPASSTSIFIRNPGGAALLWRVRDEGGFVQLISDALLEMWCLSWLTCGLVHEARFPTPI